MSDWIEFVTAMALFIVSHRLPAMLGLKAGLQRRLGAAGYTALFSLVSLGLLYWVIEAAGRAPFVPIWETRDWHRWAVNLVMPLVGLLAVLGVWAPNPFAFEGRPSGFDPVRPGIAGLTRQPLLWGLALWAGVHLLANGDLAHVMLFAPMLVFSILGMGVLERRRRAAMGEAEWQRLTAQTALVPLAALLAGRWRPTRGPSPIRLLIWGALWALVWHLHAPVIGVWPGV